MTRRRMISVPILVAALALATPAVAQGPVDSVVERLETQGFEVRSVRRTLLGRTRIVAESAEAAAKWC